MRYNIHPLFLQVNRSSFAMPALGAGYRTRPRMRSLPNTGSTHGVASNARFRVCPPSTLITWPVIQRGLRPDEEPHDAGYVTRPAEPVQRNDRQEVLFHLRRQVLPRWPLEGCAVGPPDRRRRLVRESPWWGD
jgi:hypothetical protein